MMTLKFCGDKPLITSSGVFFLRGKHDKYIFLPSAFKIYQLLVDSHNWHGKHLEYEYPTRMPNDEEMLQAILASDPDLIQSVEAQVEAYRTNLETQIEGVRANPVLDSREKEALANNLAIMRDYRIQRTTNKILYHTLIDKIVYIIHRREIDRLVVPPTQNNYHVLESLRGGLIGQKVSGKVAVEYETTPSGRPVLVLYPYGRNPVL